MLNPRWVHYLRHQELCVLREQIETYSRELSAPPKILEIGGGDGYMASQLIANGFDVICTDPQPRRPAYNTIIKAPASKLPFCEGQFDIIYSSNVLEHVENLTDSFKEMRRVLKQDGIMIHSVPTVACSVLTTLTTPLAYPRNIYLLITGFYFDGVDFSKPFASRVPLVRALNQFEALRKLVRVLKVILGIINPLRAIRIAGHGVAKTPLHEIYGWRYKHWVDIFENNGIELIDTVRHPLMFSMNKIFGGYFIPLRSKLAEKGLNGDLIYITAFEKK